MLKIKEKQWSCAYPTFFEKPTEELFFLFLIFSFILLFYYFIIFFYYYYYGCHYYYDYYYFHIIQQERKNIMGCILCFPYLLTYLFRIQPLNHFISRVRISDSRIDFAFSWIILSNILWNSRIKTSLLSELSSSGKLRSFCLHFKLNNSLIFYSKEW